MNVISIRALQRFYEKHAGAKQALLLWYKTASKATWKDMNDLWMDYPAADLVGDSRVIFNIKGNHYRLVARVSFKYKNVLIKFVGTHAEYDKIDPETVEAGL
ncbi:type II toxin-antitoxin system HigB family toxin [Botryobacter ruber]|uniref:type II toxin-antitoxin system HigB family toxin n=1 Tax=Botryobacter ruber TaxID=2171629 RepID=UPI000E0A0287|nr:type II toxin-antitoxin system HigB family toxin [Botryobacter ruber]